MNFVYPNFLWALFFIAVPIIIHLFYFRRYKKIYFSNTAILNEIKDERSSRNKLKHLLVLLSRILAIIFLVLAFAQPFFKTSKIQKTGEKYISIYIDNSFSMNSEGNGQLLFEESKEFANQIINSFSDNDKIQIISNDFEGKHQRFVNRIEAKSFVKDLEISSSIRTYNTVFERQKSTFKNSNNENIIYQISDFQKNVELFENDTNYIVNLVKLNSSQNRNIFIDTVWIDNSFQLINANNKMIVRFRNESNEKTSENYQLVLNNNVKSVGEYEIPKKGFAFDTINFKISKKGWNTGKIQLSDYPMTFDDVFYFSFYVEDKANVLCISETNNTIFNSVFKEIESINFENLNYKKLDYNNLNKQHLIILDELKSIPTGLSESLKQYVEKGGSIFVVPNKQMSVKTYNTLLSNLEIGAFVGKSSLDRNVSKLNFKHFILNDLFEKKPTNIKLPDIKNSFNLHTSTNITEEKIMSFKNNDTYLSSYKYKSGNIYVLTSSLDKSVSDFSSNSLFAPILYKMAILGVVNTNIFFEINGNTSIKLKTLPKRFEDVIKIKNSEIEIIPQKNIFAGFLNLSIYYNNFKAGIYEVFTEDKSLQAKVALNYSRNESFLNYYSLKELKNIFSEKNINIIAGNISEIQSSLENYKQGKMLWKWFIVFSLLFLAFEILLLKILK